jgi:hypothetical protein
MLNILELEMFENLFSFRCMDFYWAAAYQNEISLKIFSLFSTKFYPYSFPRFWDELCGQADAV